VSPSEVSTGIQLTALIVVSITQIMLAAMGVWTIILQKNLHHEMNSMKDALVESTAKASHARGMLDQQAADKVTPAERLEEIRGQQ
jgi:hypothetical protein